MVVVLLILVPVAVAGLTSLLLVHRETVQDAGRAGMRGLLHRAPRAAGFGRGGVPVPVAGVGDEASLDAFVVDARPVPWRTRILRLVLLALVVVVAASVVAGLLYLLGHWFGQALNDYVTEQRG